MDSHQGLFLIRSSRSLPAFFFSFIRVTAAIRILSGKRRLFKVEDILQDGAINNTGVPLIIPTVPTRRWELGWLKHTGSTFAITS
jgi:hypothetical protein